MIILGALKILKIVKYISSANLTRELKKIIYEYSDILGFLAE